MSGGFTVSFVVFVRRYIRRIKRAMAEQRQESTILASIQLYSCLRETQSGLPFLREFLKLSVRSLANPKQNQKWMHHWNSAAQFSEMARSTPSVLKKIYRPYLTQQLSCQDRLDILTSHYAFILRHGLSDIISRASKSPVLLSQFEGKSKNIYQIELAAITVMEREGELVLQLVSEGIVLFSVAFTFFDHAGSRIIALGCLQGGRSADSLDRIRFATRDMFGLRPKTLMVRLAQQIGTHFACDDMLLVGNKNRVVTQPLRKGIVFADYDTTWTELGAAQRLDGDFKLPCNKLTEPDLQAIASSKRSEAKKKFALLSTVSKLTCEGFSHPQYA
jgi:uncharacterized protein VirK/YbjX